MSLGKGSWVTRPGTIRLAFVSALLAPLQREPGRCVGALGSGALVVAAVVGMWLNQLSDQAGLALAGMGMLVFAGSALGGLIEEISFGRNQKLRMREPGRDRNQEAGDLERGVRRARDEQLGLDAVDLPGDPRTGTRYILGQRAIGHLLESLDGPLAGCEARVFLYDDGAGGLTPAFRPPDAADEPVTWLPGQGVTGSAYKRGVYVSATGSATHDKTYGLDDGLQERFASLTAVAAAPLFSSQDQIFGVLSISSKAPETLMCSPEGVEEHIVLAELVAVALEELLGVDPDDE